MRISAVAVLRELTFVTALLTCAASWGCGGDDGGSAAPEPEACADACSAGERDCDGNRVLLCERSSNGCLDWTDERDCGAGARCEEGACNPCPDGCCGSCDGSVCGPGSDDGCGRSCGDAVQASDLPEDLTETMCATVVPCCNNTDLLCAYDSITDCRNYIDGYRVSTLWCTSAVDLCLGALERLDCATFGRSGLPEVCVDLYEGRFEVVPATGPCEELSEQRCGPLGTCVDVAESVEHCGECDVVCAQGESCQDGVCGS